MNNWLNQVRNGQPTGFKPGKNDSSPPAAWLDLEYVYGYRCFDSRNNIKFTKNGELVYPTAALGISLDVSKNHQKFFMEHTDDVTCIDIFDNLIVSGQVGLDPLICIWEIGSASKAVFRGVLKQGVSYITFSNDGKKIAAVGMDDDHCIVVYDVDKALSSRGQGRREDFLVASGKGPRSEVFDIKFDKVDKNLIIACKCEVYFATYENFQIKLTKGLWDAKTCPFSAVLCIGIVETSVITGTFKGHVIVWRGNRATQS
jgi:WD40 repeat protein